MDDVTRSAVAIRAKFSCEYCHLREDDDVYTFHVEHVIAVKHGGSSDLANLAFACQHCNLHKGSNLSGIDPISRAIVDLFHPRRQVWKDHFLIDDNFLIVGRSPLGRATVQVLAINDPDRVNLRAALGYREIR